MNRVEELAAELLDCQHQRDRLARYALLEPDREVRELRDALKALVTPMANQWSCPDCSASLGDGHHHHDGCKVAAAVALLGEEA